MAVEQWELLPSSKPDRYILKIRGDRSDVDKVIEAYPRICQPPRELDEPVYKWAIVIVEASLNERLAIQDYLREVMSPRPEAAPSVLAVDLSGVLTELNMVLEGLTGLTKDEQAHVAKKMQEIQQREATQPQSVKPSTIDFGTMLGQLANVAAPSAEETEKPKMDIPAPVLPPAEIPVSPPVAVPGPAVIPPSEPPLPPVQPSLVAAPLPPELENVPAEQILRAVFFLPSGAEPLKDKFLRKLEEMSRQKAKKPIFIHAVFSQITTVSGDQSTSWVDTAKAVQAECFFVILPPDIPPEFMDEAVNKARQAGLNCFLIPPSEVESRLLYVDLMVELMLVKRKK